MILRVTTRTLWMAVSLGLLIFGDVRGQGMFVRGDLNCDGVVDATDASLLPGVIFGGDSIPCFDAADINDDGILDDMDTVALNDYFLLGTAPPPPFPDCGVDPTPDAVECDSSCCPPAVRNHFKTWLIERIPYFGGEVADDQFMSDSLPLDTIRFLSNPAQKDTFSIVDPNDHLLWYSADGRDTCLEVVFENQFGIDTVVIGTVRFLLSPAQKLPHPPWDTLLDFYKAYEVWARGGLAPETLLRPTEIQDQFDQVPELVDSLVPRYFLTPATRGTLAVHDSTTHYVAYAFQPGHDTALVRDVVDLLNDTSIVRVRRSEFLLVPTEKIAYGYICPIEFPGDVTCDGAGSSADLIHLINYIFRSGFPPCPCEAAADADCSGSLTTADIIYLVNWIFRGGAPPCDPCTIIPALWECSC